MSTVDYLSLRKKVIYTSAGTPIPDTYLYTVSSSVPAWTNTPIASTLGLSTLTLANTAVSLGLSTNSTTIGFSQGNYAAGYWSTATGVSASTIKRVNMSASGQYQTIANQSTNNLYYSNNSGSTWSTLSGVVGPITDAGLSASSQNMIVGTASTNVYVSNNYESTFTAKNLGAPFGYFQFENNLNDTQGNMTLTNYGSAVSYVAGQVGTNAVRLTNTLGAPALQYLRAPWNAPQAFTISGWFNAATVNTSVYQAIAMAYNDSVTAYINATDNKLALKLPTGSGTGVNTYFSPSAIVAGTWYSFTMIFQTNGLCSAYMNNILLGSFMNSGGFGTNVNVGLISFGAQDGVSTNSPFNGSLDDIRIFPYAVSPVGPNLYFPFENSTADVISGSTVTVTGTPTYVTGLSTGSALRLTNTLGSAATQYLRIGWNAPAAFTITGWVNLATLDGTNFQLILSAYSGIIQVYIISGSSKLSITVPTGSGTNYFSFNSPSALLINTWYSFTVIYQANGICSGYMNNVLLGSGINSGGFGTCVNTGLLSLGTYDHGTGWPMNGSIDDLRIYNTANLYPTATISKNYPVVAVSGNGQYQLAGTTDGELFLSSDSGSTWTIQPSAKILGSWQSLSLSHTGQYMAATASTTQVTPNLTSLTAATWTQNGVTWTASASSLYPSTSFTPYAAFNNVASATQSDVWASAGTYNGSGAYTGSVSTTVQGMNTINGEWLQLQSNLPVVLQSYAYIQQHNGASNNPKTYYIVGSNDGSTWYPIHNMVMTTNPSSASQIYTRTTYIQINYTGTQTIIADNTVSGSSTAYSYTTNAYTYFRIIGTSIYAGGSAFGIGEFYPIFTNGSSTSINYGASWAPGSTSAQAVSVPQYTQTTPNQTSLAAYTWTQNGVNWTVSASSYYNTSYYPYYAFNLVISGSTWNGGAWYNNVTGAYGGSTLTTVTGVGSVSGEWLQLQSSVPLVMTTHNFAAGGWWQIPKSYYIVGSNDGSTWYAVHYGVFTATPFNTNFATSNTPILINVSGAQSYTGNITTTLTSTTYSTTLNAYSYYRLITPAICGNPGGTNAANNDSVSIGEWYPIFVIPTTTTSTGSVLSNAVVSQSGSGQYAIGLDSNIPLARLTLDNTATDLLGALTPATGAGTVTYSSSVVKVGTYSAFFNNTPGSNSPATYLNYTVPASLYQPSALTMSCWVYPTSYGVAAGGNSSPITLTNGTNYANQIYITSSGVVRAYWATTVTSGGTDLVSAAIIPLNAWSHLAMTFSSGVISLYVNGSCVANVTAGGNLCAIGGGNMTNLYVGCNFSTSNAFLGYIDDVRLYTTALSSLQIANFYSNPAYQAVKVSSSTITGLSSTAVATVPALAGLNANVIASAVSFTGQYMVLVTAGTTNNVYYSINYGATFTALTIGSSAMVSCAISADGSYINVANATTSYRLNSNATGYTLAIGNSAGAVNQASNAIAIGNQAGAINQSANSIILNASGSALNAVESGFYVAPILTASSASASSSIALLGYGADSQVVQSAVTVLSNGNVGIGTTNPGYLLDVNGITRSAGVINTSPAYYIGYTSSNPTIYKSDGTNNASGTIYSNVYNYVVFPTNSQTPAGFITTTGGKYSVAYSGIYTITFTTATGAGTNAPLETFISKNQYNNSSDLNAPGTGTLASSYHPASTAQSCFSWTGYLSTSDFFCVGFFTTTSTGTLGGRTTLSVALVNRSG